MSYESEIIECHNSDHNAQVVEVNVKLPDVQQCVYKRDFSRSNISRFEVDLNRESWQPVFEGKDTDSKWNAFFEIFMHYFDSHFPLVKIYIRNKVKFWDTPEIEECRSKLDLFYVLSRYLPGAKAVYNNLKQRYSELLKQAKSNNINRRLSSADNKSKVIW